MPTPEKLRPTPDALCSSTTRHGDANAYKHHRCRCRSARKAAVLEMKRRRAGLWPVRMVDALGSRRRLQSLAAIGHGVHTVAERIGRCGEGVSQVRRGKVQTVGIDTHRLIAAVYEELLASPGPDVRAIRYAERQQWPTPGEWEVGELDDPAADPRAVASHEDVDEGAVLDAVMGHAHQPLLRLSVAEQDQAVRYLLEHVSPEEAQFRLGCTVDEWRLAVDRVRTQKRRDREKDRRAAQRQQQGSEAA